MVSPDEREELAALRAENARLIGLLVAKDADAVAPARVGTNKVVASGTLPPT